jgi:hypothetical protein
LRSPKNSHCFNLWVILALVRREHGQSYACFSAELGSLSMRTSRCSGTKA